MANLLLGQAPSECYGYTYRVEGGFELAYPRVYCGLHLICYGVVCVNVIEV